MAFGLLRRTLAWARGEARLRAAAPEPPAPAPVPADLVDVDRLIDEGNLEDARHRLEALASVPRLEAQVAARRGKIGFLEGQYSDAARILRDAASADPSNAIAQKYLAASRLQLGDARSAIAAGIRAAQLDPQDGELHNILGAAYTSLGQFEGAVEHFHRALELDRDNPIPLMNLQVLEQRLADSRKFVVKRPVTEAVRAKTLDKLTHAFGRRALDLQGLEVLLSLAGGSREHFALALEVAGVYWNAQGLSPNAVMSMAVVFERAGDVERGLRLRETAYRLDSSLPETRLGLGQALVVAGGERWAEGWRLIDASVRRMNPPAYATEVPEWDGRDIGQQRLFVYQEQGFGDTVLALRFVPLLAQRGVRVVLWVKSALGELARSITGYELCLASETRPDPRAHGCTCAAPLLGLITLLRLDRAALKTPPLLHAPAARVLEWRNRLASLPGRRVGLAATGNENRADDWLRTIPTEALAPLSSLHGISWINLAVDRRAETESAVALLGMTDPTARLLDYAETAALIETLDVVVAIDCSVAHIAGSLGKSLWVLAPSFPDWRWQVDGDTRPWWPTATVLRADGPGIWTKAIARLVEELASRR